MKHYKLIIVFILSLGIGGLGISQAGTLACPSSCPECKPVQQMNCCGVDSMSHTGMSASSMQPAGCLPPVECQGEFCSDIYYPADDVLVNWEDTTLAATPAPRGFSSYAIVTDSQTPPLPPDRTLRTVPLYNLNCSYLN